ncbi:MAG: electron transport complex subunit RsxE [Firmicutes bacterium]|nr:electron transport complex subunit RsxE [Bacillota bacterium]
MDTQKIKTTALSGIINNPVFVLVLGICPTLVKSTNISDAFALGASTALVLVMSNVLISALRKVIPSRVRIPAYIMMVATCVTVVRMFMHYYMAAVYDSLGDTISMIVVNCIILARAESFASQNNPLYAALDGVSIGAGFIGAICLLGGFRQLLILAGFAIFGQAPGGFIALALLMAIFNFVYKIVLDYTSPKQKLIRAQRRQAAEAV